MRRAGGTGSQNGQGPGAQEARPRKPLVRRPLWAQPPRGTIADLFLVALALRFGFGFGVNREEGRGRSLC